MSLGSLIAQSRENPWNALGKIITSYYIRISSKVEPVRVFRNVDLTIILFITSSE